MARIVDVVDGQAEDETPFEHGRIAAPREVPEAANFELSQVEGVYVDVLTDVIESSAVSPDDHFFDDLGADSLVMAKFCARVRKRPGVPVASMKDIYRFPTVRTLAAALTNSDDQTPVTPGPSNSVLGGVVPNIPSPPHQFHLSGTAPRLDVSPISHPVMPTGSAARNDPIGTKSDSPPHAQQQAGRVPARGMFAVCGAIQLLFFVGYSYVLACVVSYDFEWINSAGGPLSRLTHLLLSGHVLAPIYALISTTGALGIYLRSVCAVIVSFVVVSSLPVAVKWVLVGRWKAGEFPVWGWSYIRFWVVKTLVRMNPVVLFAGSPVFNLYLRALGAKVGRGVLILTPTVPVCTDLLSIGAGSVLRKDVMLSCYRAHAATIQTGPVRLGENVFVSESTVVDIDTTMGDSSQLGHASSLHRGQSIPAGESWHGTPAQPCDTDFRASHDLAQAPPGSMTASNGCAPHPPTGTPGLPGEAATDWSGLGCPVCPIPDVTTSTTRPEHLTATTGSPAAVLPEPGGPASGAARRWVFSVGQLVSLLGIRLPLATGGLLMLVSAVPWLAAATRFEEAVFASWAAVARIAALTAAALALSVVAGLALVAVSSRALRLMIRPDRVYRLYGTRYWAHRAVTRLTNRKSMTRLFGDSSYIVGYLRYLGYHLSTVEQTGSNFGTDVKHETPFLASVGAGTMVADGLSLMNTDYTTSTFRVSRTVIGAHNFLGNRIAYPAGGRTGDNCLLATKVMVPIDGPIRENVGLLGSPAFEIPRTVQRDHRFDITDPAELRTRLRAKNRHNLATMMLHLLASWGQLFGLAIISLATAALYSRLGISGVAAGLMTSFVFRIGYFITVDRCVRGLQALRPQGCSIYDRAFWRHERFWKIADSDYIQLFNGTPYKTLLWRLLGVKVGRGVFDDGAFLPERSFATIGDHATLNAGCVIQCHSQEDGAFKSDRSAIGAHTTLGVGAFVHYGVVIGDHVTLDADAFVMKGEQLDPDSHWSGNPARPVATVGHIPATIDEHYVNALLAHISDLETKIGELTPARAAHPATKPLAAALAVLTIAGGVTATAHTALAAAVPAAWQTLLSGVKPSTPATSSPTPPNMAAPAIPPPPPAPTMVTPVRRHLVRPTPATARQSVARWRAPSPRPGPAANPPTSQAQAEAALKQAQTVLKAIKAEQKESKTSKDSKDGGK